MWKKQKSNYEFKDVNDELLLRYSRQIMLPEFDYDGQQSVADARVLVIGVGGLGSPAAMYLAAAGVGNLVLVDDDVVELSNLQRQIVHRESTVGQSKVASAEQTLSDINPHCQVTAINERLDKAALDRQIQLADIVLDCTDNFSSRYLTNRLCIRAKTPLVSAAAIRWEGQLMVIDPRDEQAPCYECLYGEGQEQNLNCSETGIMSPVVGMMGTWQALEAIKVLSGAGQPLTGKLSVFDGLTGQWRQLKLPRNPKCTACGQK